MTSKRIAAVVVIALGAAGGTAWASGAISAIVGADGTINGCYKQQNGQLRVVGAGATCGPSELALQWNRQGPQGLQGAQGPKGENGAAGPAGIQGLNGSDGQKGETGAPGAQGLQGLPGSQGPAGQKGDTGSAGVSGYEVVINSAPAPPLQDVKVSAKCPPGKKPTGGGGALSAETTGTMKASYPSQAYPSLSYDGWEVIMRNISATFDALIVWVVCAS